MLTPDTVGLSPEDALAYFDQRRFLSYQYKVLKELRPVWPVPAHILSESYERVRDERPNLAVAVVPASELKESWGVLRNMQARVARLGEQVWSQRDLIAAVAGQCDEFPNYLRVVPMRDVTPAALLKREPADNPALRAYFKLLSLLPDQAVLVFPVLHHGNWVAHNLGQPPFPQPVVRAVLPAVSKNRHNIEILPIKTFSKEFSDGKEREED